MGRTAVGRAGVCEVGDPHSCPVVDMPLVVDVNCTSCGLYLGVRITQEPDLRAEDETYGARSPFCARRDSEAWSGESGCCSIRVQVSGNRGKV